MGTYREVDLINLQVKRVDAAAACIIINSYDHFLLQLRDENPRIWFPGNWGCFGGALDCGETIRECAIREVKEELSINISEDELVFFTDLTFNLSSLGSSRKYRAYFLFFIDRAREQAIKLTEGQTIQHFSSQEVMSLEPFAPYDKLALSQYILKDCFVPKEPIN